MSVLVDAILCDDIRQEASGKLIFVGVYPNNLLLSEFPMTAMLTLWVRVHGLTNGEHENTLSLKLGDTEIFAVEGTLFADGKTAANAFVRGIPVEVKEPGTLSVEIDFLDGRHFEAAPLPVMRMDQSND